MPRGWPGRQSRRPSGVSREESYNGAKGKPRVTGKGKYVCIWSLQADGSWKAIRDIWNADSR